MPDNPRILQAIYSSLQPTQNIFEGELGETVEGGGETDVLVTQGEGVTRRLVELKG